MADRTGSRDAAPARAADAPGASASASVPAPRTERTRIRRHADRAVPDRIEEFLRTGHVAHVALVENGEPRLIPFLYHYEDPLTPDTETLWAPGWPWPVLPPKKRAMLSIELG